MALSSTLVLRRYKDGGAVPASLAADWLERATKKRAEIEKLYDARFFRMWEFYLAGGIVMFESGAACNYQVQYVRDRNALPITRDYMLENERKYREIAAGSASTRKPRGAGRRKALEEA